MRVIAISVRCVTQSVYQSLAKNSITHSHACNRLCARQLNLVRYTHEISGRRGNRDKSATVRSASIVSAFGATQVPSMLQAILSPAAVAVAILSTVVISAWASATRKTWRSDITTQTTEFNKGVLSRCPTINAPYQAWPFLTNGHVETIFASKTRRSPPVEYDRESFGCPDGGTVHLDYHRLPSSIVGSFQQQLL